MRRKVLEKVNGRLRLYLSPKEIGYLKRFRDRHDIPYIRERVAAILKIAEGMSPRQVALNGLLKRRDPDSVYDWLYRYVRCGVRGLFQKPRNTREKVTEAQKTKLKDIIMTQTPMEVLAEQNGVTTACMTAEDSESQATQFPGTITWTLRRLHELVDFLRESYKSLSGVWRLLQRIRMRLKRGRPSVRSDDPNFNYKIRRIRGVLGYCLKHPDKAVMLSLDEFSFCRQPVVNRAWWRMGRLEQPVARRARKSNTKGRIVAVVNCYSGRVDHKMAKKISLPVLCQFLKELREIYPERKLYILMDNWHNVHDHEKLLALMKELTMIPVYTPTYTPEANPIERLWEKLSKEQIYLHRLSHAWEQLKQQISHWLNQFKRPSQEILRLVGLIGSSRKIHVDLR
jgi:transposase